jgi:hypothetical protein
MRRLLVVGLCLLLMPANLHASSGSAAPGTPTTIPLESLTFVTSSGVAIDSATHPGSFLGHPILRGLELGPSQFSSVTFALNGQYDVLAGTVYVNDAQKTAQSFSISGIDAHGSKSSLYALSLGPKKQAAFKVSTHGFTSITLTNGATGVFDVVADLTPATKATPAPTGPQVIVRYPVGGAGVAAGTKVPFAWQPFAHASSYILQLWLVQQTSNTPINASTPVTLSTLVYHQTSYTWDTTGFLPGVYQYDLIPLDADGNALAPRNNQQQITLAS